MRQLYLIPDFKNIDKTCEQAEKWNAAFEYNDFFCMDLMDDEITLKNRIDFYKSIQRNRSKDTMHGAFFDLSVSSEDAKIRELSRMRMRQSMEVASKLSVKAVIFHTNLIAGFELSSYLERWLFYHTDFLKKLLEEYQGIQIYVENMFDRTPNMLEKLAREIDCPGFGICYDVAHGNLGTCRMEEWFDKLHPYMRHLHVNDNDGKSDQHRAVGSGSIDWSKFDFLMRKYKPDAGILAEVSSFEAKAESLHYMKEKQIYPFW